MGYWKSKVLPKIKKIFKKDGTKTEADEACKSFENSKEEINKEFEEKRTELEPKVIQVYEASSEEIKALIKEPKEGGVKKHSTSVTLFLEELVKIEFPGSKHVSEVSSKYGPALVPDPVIFLFEKVSTFIVVEKKEEVAEPANEETSTAAKEEIVVEAKEEEVVAAVDVEKTEPLPPAEAEPTAEEPPKP